MGFFILNTYLPDNATILLEETTCWVVLEMIKGFTVPKFAMSQSEAMPLS